MILRTVTEVNILRQIIYHHKHSVYNAYVHQHSQQWATKCDHDMQNQRSSS